MLLCGGGGPITAAPALFTPLPSAIAQNFPLYFFIQKKDFLYQQTQQAINYWRARKAQVLSESPEGGSHCGFDFIKELRRGIKKVLR